MLKIGHRGASAACPENTLLAFRRAVELGADGIELDVHLCQSGEVVVIHDDTLERTTNGKGPVNAHTLAELQALDAGHGERIPSLREVLEQFASAATILIEIKSSAAAHPTATLISELASKGLPYTHMPVIGFDERWLLSAHEVDANILIGPSPDDRGPLDPAFCDRAAAIGAWSINPSIKQLDVAFVAAAHRHRLKVITWTANSPAQIDKARQLGVDGIMSDYPDRLK